MATVPCFIEVTQRPVYTYKPIGLKVWSFAVLVLVSLIPILNIIVIIAAIIVAFVHASKEHLTMTEVFPKRLPKWYTFFNKPL